MGTLGQDPAGNQTDKWTLQLLKSPLPPPRSSGHCQKGQILTNEIMLPRVMGKTLPLQVTNLPTAFGTRTLKSVKQLPSVITKDTCRTAMKRLVNAGTMALKYAAKRNSLCFYWIRSNHTMLTKLYSHQLLVTAIAQEEGRHSTSRQLEKAVPVMYAGTWLFSNIYGSQLPPLHYTIRGRKSTINPFMSPVIESNHVYNIL